MKIILAGTTGFIGSEVLAQCSRDPSINFIIVLSRRPLPDALAVDPSKVRVIVMKDFKVYPEEVVKQMKDADACIWSMGPPGAQAIPEIEIDYPLAFARALAPTLTSRETPFRYMHTSGALAERDQSKSLPFLQQLRHIKGMAQNRLLEFAQQEVNQGRWETYIVEPAMVLPKEGDVLRRLWGFLVGSVKVEELAAVMIDVVSNGNKDKILQNAQIVEKGRILLK
ncbi:hypothetical protein B0H11DRAFT_1864441 [Mycena galericulata]|nr:hypothetical protein B0H11DRAFT_1864441 [Mycena galericulata]